jgi:hypothetical protein
MIINSIELRVDGFKLKKVLPPALQTSGAREERDFQRLEEWVFCLFIIRK